MLENLQFDATKIERPNARLFSYYLWCAILTGPLTPFVLLPLWFRYITLKYKFDEDGVSMSWGVLFKREIYLTYRRIQDIHLTRNLLQRWMGLAKISLQTASGNAAAEMTIEGILEAEQLRDFLYSRMRGARDGHTASNLRVSTPLAGEVRRLAGEVRSDLPELDRSTEADDAVLHVLVEIRNSLREIADKKGRPS